MTVLFFKWLFCFRLFRVIFFILCLNHIAACAWYAISYFVLAKHDSNMTWIVRDESSLSASNVRQYCRSAFWSLITTTTVGYGNLVSFSI